MSVCRGILWLVVNSLNSDHVIALFYSIYLHVLLAGPACFFIQKLFLLPCPLFCYFAPSTGTYSLCVRNYGGINQMLVLTLERTRTTIHV